MTSPLSKIAQSFGGSAVASRQSATARVLLTPGSAAGAANRADLRLSVAAASRTVEEGLARLQSAPRPKAKIAHG